MCVQSVSLWAEATWYRLGGGRPETDDSPGRSHGPATVASSPVEAAPAQAEREDEKILVRL